MATRLKRFEDGIILKPTTALIETVNGAMWVTSTAANVRIDGTNREIATLDQVQAISNKTLTNCTIDSDSNTITNIVNADIKASAGILYSKLSVTSSDLTNTLSNESIVDTKLAQITTASKVALSAIVPVTMSRVIQSNATTGLFEASSITNTELSYLSGATSAILGKDQSGTFTLKTIDADNNTISNLETDNLKSGVLITDVSLTGHSNTNIPSTTAIKSYVDTQVAAKDTLAEMTDVSLSSPTQYDVLVRGASEWNNSRIVNANIDNSAAIATSKLADSTYISEAVTFFTGTDFDKDDANELISLSNTSLHHHNNTYYTETELDGGQLDNRYFRENELTPSTGAALIGTELVGSVPAGNVQSAIANLDERSFSPITSPITLTTTPIILGSALDAGEARIIDYILKNGTVYETGVITAVRDASGNAQLSVHCSSTGDSFSEFTINVTGLHGRVTTDNTASIKFSYRTLTI